MTGVTPHTWEASTPDGYVVGWFDGIETIPLACFGDWHSAAIQFRRMVDKRYSELKPKEFQRMLDYLRRDYQHEPKRKCTYPIASGKHIFLSSQKEPKDIKQ